MFVDMKAGVHGLTRRNPLSGDTLIAVASRQTPERQRFSLAHELGHVRAGDLTGDIGTLHTAHDEVRANAFARHLLAPIEGVRRLACSASGLDLGSDIVRHYQVSPNVAAIQMRDIGAPTADVAAVRAATAEELAQRFGWAHQRRAAIELSKVNRPPRRIVAGAQAALSDGAISPALAAFLSAESLADLPTERTTEHDESPSPAHRANPFDTGATDW